MRSNSNRKPATAVLMVLILFASAWTPAALGVEKLTPELVSELVPQLFHLHLKERQMNAPFMKRMLKEFVNHLDPAKSFFLKGEADAIIELSDAELSKLADRALNADFAHFTALLKGFLETQVARDAAFYDGLDKRADEIKTLAEEKSKTAAAESATPKPEKPAPKEGEATAAGKDAGDEEDSEDGIKWNERPATLQDREARLMKAVAFMFQSNKKYLSETEAMKQALLSLRDERNKWVKVKVEEEVPKLFLKSFMAAMDPHTVYFDAEEDEEFIGRLEPTFAGIGVQIRPCPLGAQIEDIIKGGPSEKSGKFAQGDQIVRVDETSLAGMPINKIVRYIKGKKGTPVCLVVLKRATKQTEVITLIRDDINLADMRVKNKKFDTPAGTVGLISVQTFYRGVSNEVRERLKDMNNGKQVDAMVLDLRHNHGGYLEEAVALAGLFLGGGPVVGEKNGAGKIDWKDDTDPGIYYNGPLVVLTNQFSASASEIVAGTLKDYGRAVVASPTQTFGKGTVQRVIPLIARNLPGEVKITTHQYYLAGGGSVQQKGVEPDVVIPGFKLFKEALEGAAENSIPFDQIKPRADLVNNADVKQWTEWKKNSVAKLQEKSKQRMDANPEIKDFYDTKKRKAKEEAERKEAQRLNPDEPPPVTDHKKEEKDPQADEAVALAADMVTIWPKVVKQASK